LSYVLIGVIEVVWKMQKRKIRYHCYKYTWKFYRPIWWCNRISTKNWELQNKATRTVRDSGMLMPLCILHGLWCDFPVHLRCLQRGWSVHEIQKFVCAKILFRVGKFAKTCEVIAHMPWDYLQGARTKEAD